MAGNLRQPVWPHAFVDEVRFFGANIVRGKSGATIITPFGALEASSPTRVGATTVAFMPDAVQIEPATDGSLNVKSVT